MGIGLINRLITREMKNSENIKGGAEVERGIFFGKLPVILCNNVGTLEKNVGTLGKNVGTLEKNVGTPGENVGTLEKNVGTPGKNVGTPGKNVGTLDKNVGTLGKNVGFLGCEKLHLGDYSINCNLSKTLIINYIYIYKYLN
jgi:hypothetical protein